ncbi:hypothetical protein ES703_30565 [subsurface metagenome]
MLWIGPLGKSGRRHPMVRIGVGSHVKRERANTVIEGDYIRRKRYTNKIEGESLLTK